MASAFTWPRSKVVFLLLLFVCVQAAVPQNPERSNITQASLAAFSKKGEVRGDCPLKSTSVKTDISGFIARVRVRHAL